MVHLTTKRCALVGVSRFHTKKLRSKLHCARYEGGKHIAQHASFLEAANNLARQRVLESQQDDALFEDSFSEALLNEVEAGEKLTSGIPPYDSVATKYVDECCMRALSLTNEKKGDYNQMVLLGCGFDSRPYRLPWRPGIVIFSIAPTEIHQIEEACALKLKARVPRGSLLVRVHADIQKGESFMEGLERSGFRGDRLSVWAMQGLSYLGFTREDISRLFVDVSNLASFHSLIMGELPEMSISEAKTLLAEFSFMGAVVEFGDPEAHYNRWQTEWTENPAASRRFLFNAQQQRLSLSEMGIYHAHVEAAEETDEDFFDNFS